MAEQAVEPLAKWAFGTSLVVHSGPGTLLGVLALRRIRRDGTRGAALATAAIVIDVINAVVSAVVLARRSRSAR